MIRRDFVNSWLKKISFLFSCLLHLHLILLESHPIWEEPSALESVLISLVYQPCWSECWNLEKWCQDGWAGFFCLFFSLKRLCGKRPPKTCGIIFIICGSEKGRDSFTVLSALSEGIGGGVSWGVNWGKEAGLKWAGHEAGFTSWRGGADEVLDGQSARSCGHSQCSGTAWCLCACESDVWARRSVQSATCSPPTYTDMVSLLK